MTERGADGLLTLTAHASMPGVLIRVEATDRGNGMAVVVRSVEGAPWERVRSGDPVRLLRSGGVYAGHAFDLAAVPGKRTAYAVLDAAGAVDERRSVSILLPPLGPVEAWIKSAFSPGLSRSVCLVDGGNVRATGAHGVTTDIFGSPVPHVISAGRSATSYDLTAYCPTYDDVLATRALLMAPGPLLIQAAPEGRSYDAWVAWRAPGEVREDRIGDWGSRTLTVPVVEVDAPATLDAPLLVPPGSYAEQSRAARSWAEYAAGYPTGGDALLAAIGADRGGDT